MAVSIVMLVLVPRLSQFLVIGSTLDPKYYTMNGISLFVRFTADQLMPYVHAGASESDVMTYLKGTTVSVAKP